jgi:hypothetical protein
MLGGICISKLLDAFKQHFTIILFMAGVSEERSVIKSAQGSSGKRPV